MRPIFIDKNLQADFDKNGYTIVPFLNQDEVAALKKAYFDLMPMRGGHKSKEEVDFDVSGDITYDFTFTDNNWRYKEVVFNIITQAFQAKHQNILLNYKPIIANFIRKEKDAGEVPLHQNWAFVDEEKYTSVSIWVPLVDSNEHNGTLQMVDGSHKKFGKIRGPMIPWELDEIGDTIIENHLTPMNVTAGQAVILDDSILHYSNVNATNGLRLAIQLIMIPEECPSIHYHLDPRNNNSEVEVLEVEKDFYTKFHPWLKPKGVSVVSKFKHTTNFLDVASFNERLQGPRFDIFERQNNALFKDFKLQQQFDKDGFISLPFLNNEELTALKALYKETHPKPIENGFYSSSFKDDTTYQTAINQGIAKIFKQKINNVFNKHKPLGASFLVKNPGQAGTMPIHQDWTVVDENRYQSVTIWLPLQDVDENNGALQVLKGSHLWSNAIRAPKLPNVFEEVHDILHPYLTTIPLKAGEAIIFNHALLHASNLNQQDIARVAATYGMVPLQAPLYFYHPVEQKENTIEKIAVPDNFFIEYGPKIGTRPSNGQHLEFIDYTHQPITPIQLKHTLKNMTPTNNNLNNIKPNKAMTISTKKLFKDPALQKQFEEDGYAVIDILDETAVSDLLTHYNNLDNNHKTEHGFHVSLDNKNEDFVGEVMDKIKTTFANKADSFFEDYKIFTASYVVKESNPQGVVPPHQDWTFVKEEEGYTSATVWTPLVDVNTDNGALGVLVGSHKLFDYPRASPAPDFKTPFDEHVFSIFPYLKIVELKAGQALVFNNKTVHASAPNITDAPRIAAGIGITQKDAQLVHYHMKHDNPKQLEYYEIDENFFKKYNNKRLLDLYKAGQTIEDGQLIKVLDYQKENITADDLVQRLQQAGNTINIPLVTKMSQLFGGMEQYQNENSAGASEPNSEQQNQVTEHTTPETFWEIYTPERIAAELKHKAGIYTPQNVLAEIQHRYKQSPAQVGAVLLAVVIGILTILAQLMQPRR